MTAHRVTLSMITITPYGAAGEVTGSAYLVETESSTILVDFGMFQGDKDDDARNVIPGRIHRMDIASVVLTHGHLDHCGRLPLLVREGYRGPIFCTEATRDLSEIIMADAAHIQESDFERRKRRAERKGHKVNRNDEPLYDADDVEHQHRRRKQHLAGRVLSGTGHGRHDEDDQDGIFEVLDQEFRRDDAESREHEDRHRHLEDQAQAEHHSQVERKRRRPRGRPVQELRVEFGEELPGHPKGDSMSKVGASQEQRGGGEHQQVEAGADAHLPDADGRVRQRYAVPANGAAYLLRPDQHVCARWLVLDADRLQAALATALPA